jgi:hypothetical protein
VTDARPSLSDHGQRAPGTSLIGATDSTIAARLTGGCAPSPRLPALLTLARPAKRQARATGGQTARWVAIACFREMSTYGIRSLSEGGGCNERRNGAERLTQRQAQSGGKLH